MDKERLDRELQRIVREYQEFNGSTCDEAEELTLLTLCRHVAKNRPLVVRGWGRRLKCLGWTGEELARRITADVEVASSPHGLADSVYNDQFVEPYVERMSMSALLDRLADPTSAPAYMQSQDGNLLKPELNDLLKDVGGDIDVATSLFDSPPDAVNLWIGDERSTTSLHADPYENLYLCVQGAKTFTLYPPSEFYCMHKRPYRPATWKKEEGEFSIEPADESTSDVPWIPVDPLRPDYEACPRFRHARQMRVTLGKGDLLYLPALWHHHVQQKGDPLAIAANWWYDMDYGAPVYSLHRLVRSLTLALDGQSAEDP